MASQTMNAPFDQSSVRRRAAHRAADEAPVGPDAAERELVLRAALSLASRHGYHGPSTERLAAETGLSPDQVARLFPDRGDLLREVLHRSFDDWYDEVPVWKHRKPHPQLRIELERRFERGLLASRSSAGFWHLGLVLHLEPELQGRAGFELYQEVRSRALSAMRDYWAQILPAELSPEDLADLLDLVAPGHLALLDGVTVAAQSSPAWDLPELMSFVAAGIAGAVLQAPLTAEPAAAPPPDAPRPARPVEREIPAAILHATLLGSHQRSADSLTFEVIAEIAGVPASTVEQHAETPQELVRKALRQGYEEWRDSVPTWQPIPPGGSLAAGLTGILRDTWRGLDVPDFALALLLLLRPDEQQEPVEPEPDPVVEVGATLGRGDDPADARGTVVMLRTQAEDEFTAWFRQAIERDPAIGPQELGIDRLCARLVILCLDGFVLGRHLGSPLEPDDFRAMLVNVVVAALHAGFSSHTQHLRHGP